MPLQTLIFAGQQMKDDRQLKEYHVPPVRLHDSLIKVEQYIAKLLQSAII